VKESDPVAHGVPLEYRQEVAHGVPGGEAAGSARRASSAPDDKAGSG